MFDRENWLGVVLLAGCALVAGVLGWSILTGAELVYSGPGWLPPILAAVVIGGTIYLWLRASHRI